MALQVPADVLAGGESPADVLKQIQYKYYYRGKYEEAVGALKTFLARTDLTRDVAVSAREFLAASYILSGKPDKGKEQFLHLLNEDEQYAGPDAAVFKTEVVEAYETTRDALASVKLRTAPDTRQGEERTVAAAGEPSKPIYKKWWFYVGLAAAVLVIAAAASPKEEDEPQTPPAPTGTVTVGVRVR
jgi:hypothetical protein